MENPLNILKNLIGIVNRLIDGLSLNTVRNIQQGFYFLMFILAIVAVIIGYNMGREAARIKSPPLAKNVNDAFEIDISREKSDGNFSSLLESQVLTESRYTRPAQKPYKMAPNLKPETDTGIIEDTAKKRRKPHPILRNQSEILEGQYRPEKKRQKSVDILIEDKKKKEPTPVRPDYSKDTKKEKKETIKMIENKKNKNRTPAPVLREKGIIDK